MSNTQSNQHFLVGRFYTFSLVYGLDCEIFVLGGHSGSVYCLGWGITLHDIQIAGTTIYRIVKSQYKQVAGGSGGSQNAKAGIGPALHLAWYFRQLKFRGKWFLWEKQSGWC